MYSAVIAFLAGNLIFHLLADPPDRWWGCGLVAVVPALVLAPRLRLPAWGLAGFLWTLAWTWPGLPLQLPRALETADLRVEGWVASIPGETYRRVRFELQVDTLRHGDTPIPFTGKLDLSWYDTPPPLRVGDKWRLSVRLKRPRGMANPGSSDYERWLFVKGIAARGYVRPQPPPRRLVQAARYPIDRYRQQLVERFSRLLPGSPYTGILTALAVGDRQYIQTWQWEVFTSTGTGHLIAISGLHVGLIAGLIFLLIRQGWAWLPSLGRYWPAPLEAAAGGALLGAGGYALLAGLSLPTQRAWIMIAVVMLALLGRRPIAPGRVLALALLFILLLDPAAPLAGGFWLSFGAVAAILYTLSGRRRVGGIIGPWIGLQITLLLALLPATLILFQQIPLLSPLANLLAIPWASVTVVPLTLLAVIAGWLSETLQLQLLQAAALAMDWLWRYLAWLNGSSLGLIRHPAPPLWVLPFALPGVLLLLAPKGLPGRWLGLVLCLPLLYFPAARPAPDGFWFTLLDVGQGLAAVIRTHRHTLVYDTGPRLGARFDAGRAALLPYLRQQGLRRIDTLIVSHADSQHTGGVRSLLERVPVTKVLTSSPVEVPIKGAGSCRDGIEWWWDGVHFRLLHPPEDSRLFGNDASCVLWVAGEAGRVLLPGDIERTAEATLVARYGDQLSAQILVAPHHGHRDLSLSAFIDAVHPRYVLFSTGYKNRFGYPKPETVTRYSRNDAIIMDTAQHGAITFYVDGHPSELKPTSYRQLARRYWHTP